MAEKKKILYIVESMGGGVFTYIVDPDTFCAPMSVGLYEKYLTGKGPCMAASFRDKGAGKSSLYGNHGV